eukprot:5974943-Prymnesium_polylepis.1
MEPAEARSRCSVQPAPAAALRAASAARSAPFTGVNMLRETDGTCTWDNGYTHAWTQVRAALRPHGIAIVHRKAPRA